MITVTLTDQIGLMIFGEYLPWGVWPMYISSGIWGLPFNILFSIIFSLVFQVKEDKEFRENFQTKINGYEDISKRQLSDFYSLFFDNLMDLISRSIKYFEMIFGNPKIISNWFLNLPSIWLIFFLV